MTDNEHKIHVLVTADFSEELMKLLRAVSPRLSIHQQYRDLPDSIWERVEVLYSANSIYPAPEIAPNLRWIQLNSAGADRAMRQPISQRDDVEITTVSGIHATQMAEYCLMMMLAFAYNLPMMLEHQARAHWTKESWRDFMPLPLRGRTLSIVGYGSVGRELARLATSFGMNILASKRNVMRPAIRGKYNEEGIGDPEGDLPERFYPAEAVAEMAGLCDYLVVTIPMSEANAAIIDASVFAAMKPSAVFINVARGGVVEEMALLAALQGGEIAGAALDVFTLEPLPADSPFWQLKNVFISPHVSGNSPLYSEKAAAIFAENLQRYISKLPLLNRISRERGY